MLQWPHKMPLMNMLALQFTLDFDMTMQLFSVLPSWNCPVLTWFSTLNPFAFIVITYRSLIYIQTQTEAEQWYWTLVLLHISVREPKLNWWLKKKSRLTDRVWHQLDVCVWVSVCCSIGFYSKNHEQIAWSDYLIFWELMWVNTCSSSERAARLFLYSIR